MPDPPDETNSTLIRAGSDAATFREMVEYATLLEQRPLTKLLAELPALAQLSQAKFDLTTQVLRRRFRKEGDAERQQLETFAEEIASGVDVPEVADRIRHVFKS